PDPVGAARWLYGRATQSPQFTDGRGFLHRCSCGSGAAIDYCPRNTVCADRPGDWSTPWSYHGLTGAGATAGKPFNRNGGLFHVLLCWNGSSSGSCRFCPRCSRISSNGTVCLRNDGNSYPRISWISGNAALPRRTVTAKTGSRKPVMSALPPKADMCSARADVRFGPIADIRARQVSWSL